MAVHFVKLETPDVSDRLPDMAKTPPVILSIAGFDPSSGAGATAGIKTIAAHDCYGIACLTALTVQSTKGVRRVVPLAGEIVRETLMELADDFEISAISIGMLGSADILQVVSEFLAKSHPVPTVLDPVLRSSSGAELLDGEGIALLVEELMPQATVITPNIDEASRLTGLPVTNVLQMGAAAENLHQMGAKAAVVTGGHLDPPIDLLSCAGEAGVTQVQYQGVHRQSRCTHGTGCAFATAIACRLARGEALSQAVPLAKAYVEAAIAHGYPLGQGIGPPDHLYQMRKPG